MKRKDVKVKHARALQRHYNNLKATLIFTKLGILDDEQEAARATAVLKYYDTYFEKHPDFKKWLLARNFKPVYGTGKNVYFNKEVKELVNLILFVEG